MIKIIPLRTTQAVDAVQAVAQADGHVLVAPTHAVMKDDKVIGSLSMIPTVLLWTDSKETKVRDSLELNSFLQNHVAANGGTALCLPCTEQSPYFEVAKKLGYVDIGSFKLLIKGL